MSAWLELLSDSDVLARVSQIVPSFDHDPEDMFHNWRTLQGMGADVVAFAATHAQGNPARPPATAETTLH